jgi:hypothetical protein
MQTPPTPLACPHCGAGNDTHCVVGAIPKVPHDGDISLCLYCGKWGMFEDGQLRTPDTGALRYIAGSADCRRAYAAWLLVHMRDAMKRDNHE